MPTNHPQLTDQERADQLATDIERFAGFLRDNPDLAEQVGRQKFLANLMFYPDPRSAMADFARRARQSGATTTKTANELYASTVLCFGMATLDLFASRDQVCERVVVGTHEETISGPDPEALAALPTVTRTVTVEDVEWQCTPLLAAARNTAVTGVG